MKKILTLALCIIALPPLLFTATTHATTAANLDKTTVVDCRENNTTCWPAAFDFTPAGNIFYVERYTGQIRVYNTTKHTDKHWATISNVATSGEQGVLGIAIHPNWPDKKWIYIYYTRNEPLENRVVRLHKNSDGSITRDKLLKMPAGTNHNGGVIAFGPDGKLYIANGETGDPSLSQDLNSRAGKILRLTQKGNKPSDNPFDSFVYSYGHRNSFGFAFDPFDADTSTVELWYTENGPDCNDELNLVQKGKNYGWGDNADCPNINNSGDNPVEPLYTWDSPPAVTAAAFCDDCELGSEISRDLLVGDWNGGNIYHVSINDVRTGVTNVMQLYSNGSGILGMKAGTDKQIYFSDSRGIYRLQQE